MNNLRKSINGFELVTALIKNSPTIISSIINPFNLAEVAENTSSDIVSCIERIKDRYEAITSHQSLRMISQISGKSFNLINESGISR